MVAVQFLSRRLKAATFLVDSCKGLEKLCQFIHYFKVLLFTSKAIEAENTSLLGPSYITAHK